MPLTPTMSIAISRGLLVLLVGTAAVVDLRTGRIPNWLTFPALAIGPLFWLLAYGTTGLLESLAGVFLCGLPLFLAYRVGGMPGGDLKLFAAVGGVVGPVVGIEVEFFAMVAAGLFGLGVLAYRGRLKATFGQALVRFGNRILPERWHREEREVERTRIRIGPFAVVGALAAIALEHRFWMEVFGG